MDTVKIKYYKQVKKQIPRLTKNRKKLLNMLQYSLDIYSQEHADSIYSDYINNFGEPEEYVNTLLEEEGIDDLKKSIRMRNKLVLITGIAGIGVVLAVFVWGHILHHTAVKGYIDIIIETTTAKENTTTDASKLKNTTDIEHTVTDALELEPAEELKP